MHRFAAHYDNSPGIITSKPEKMISPKENMPKDKNKLFVSAYITRSSKLKCGEFNSKKVISLSLFMSILFSERPHKAEITRNIDARQKKNDIDSSFKKNSDDHNDKIDRHLISELVCKNN